MTTARSLLPGNSADVLADLKAKVSVTQIRAGASVNRELIGLYMEIGRQFAAQDSSRRASFPEMAGFSRANLFYMKKSNGLLDFFGGVTAWPSCPRWQGRRSTAFPHAASYKPRAELPPQPHSASGATGPLR